MAEITGQYNVPGDLWDILNHAPNRVYIFSYPDDNFMPPFTLSAFITQDVTIGGNSRWEGAAGGGIGSDTGALGTANDAMSWARNIINTVTGVTGNGGVGNPQVRSPMYSIVDWVGSSSFEFSLSVIFPALTPDEDVRIPVKYLMSCVYPWISQSGTVILPPRGYVKIPEAFSIFGGETKGRRGCVGVEIGEWFVTPPILVVTNASFTLSKELTPKGLPLFASGTINFKSAVQVGVDHLNAWMNTPPARDV